MGVISMKSLLEAGVHFGHQTRRWNPKMAKYIFTSRNGIHIIDLQKTSDCLDIAYKGLFDIVAAGGKVLFVGTQKQSQEPIRDEAIRAGQFYSDKRWLGGTLTNFSGSGKNYTATFTPAVSSTVDGVVSVASTRFTDAAGNANVDGAEANNTVTMAVNTVDTTPPTATTTAPTPSRWPCVWPASSSPPSAPTASAWPRPSSRRCCRGSGRLCPGA